MNTRIRGRIVAAGLMCATLQAAGAAADGSREASRFTRGLSWRMVGPAHMSGRITDIAVPADGGFTIYCAAATGGIWKSVNNGTTWAPIFDGTGTASVGDIAVSASHPRVVWAGTGEANASSYSSWGNGVYKSPDGGRTWEHVGLENTQHIGRVLIHPDNPEIVYVAALGRLWGPNPERGLYKTEDGGGSWKNILSFGEDVGVGDAAMDPSDPDILYAAAYGRRAERFDDFDSMGIRVLPGGGIFKTTDGGRRWTRLSEGLPPDRIGRVGLAVAPSASNIVYAVVERAPRYVEPTAEQLREMSALLNTSNPGPERVDSLRDDLALRLTVEDRAAVVFTGISRGSQRRLRALFGWEALDTGGGVYRSGDGGASWRRMNPKNERAGYYSQVRVYPNDPDRVIALMVRAWESRDGGASFRQKGWAFSSFLSSRFIHGDFHALWIDPARPRHMITGTDGGLYSTWDGGDNWAAHPLPLGQFVAVAADRRDPYTVYGGLQDNGCWGGASAVRQVAGITDGDWYKIITGDGAFVAVDPDRPHIVYGESQYGNAVRLDMRTGKRVRIRPVAEEDFPPLRFNYVAPFMISSHDPRTIYFGAQCVMKSPDRGNTWKRISPDLSFGSPSILSGEGATISTLAESPLNPGLLVAGTDDGRLWMTRNSGGSWKELSDFLPAPAEGKAERYWVSRVEASHHDPAVVYAALDGHRDDDFGVHIFKTEDFGTSWRSIGGGIASGHPVNVIREDPINPGLLYAGTESSVLVSLDGGEGWERLGTGLPPVPVDDLRIHPVKGDLIAGTHGRGIHILDVHPLQRIDERVLRSEAHLFPPQPAVIYHVDWTKNRGASGDAGFRAPNPFSDLFRLEDRSGSAPPGAAIYYYLCKDFEKPVTLIIRDAAGNTIRILEGPNGAGLHQVRWDLRSSALPQLPSWQRTGSNDSNRLMKTGGDNRPGPRVGPGSYHVRLIAGDSVSEKTLEVRPDPHRVPD